MYTCVHCSELTVCIVHGTRIGHEMVSLLPVKCHVGIHCHTHVQCTVTHTYNALSHTRTMHCHTHIQCTVTNTMHCHTHTIILLVLSYMVISKFLDTELLPGNQREVLCKISCIPLVQMMAWIPHTGALQVIKHVLMIIN